VFRRYVVLSIGLVLLHYPLRAQDRPNLQIRIQEGDGATYPIGSRATRGITIAVMDEAGKPVAGVTVGFSLPSTGPGGTFADGMKTEVLMTRADGRASVWGMKWNRQAGSFEVRITATKGQARAGTVCTQRLAEATGPSVAQGGSSHKWLWIALAAAGAAGAGVAVLERSHSASSSCSATVVLLQSPCASSPNALGTTQIGTPTIALGNP